MSGLRCILADMGIDKKHVASLFMPLASLKRFLNTLFSRLPVADIFRPQRKRPQVKSYLGVCYTGETLSPRDVERDAVFLFATVTSILRAYVLRSKARSFAWAIHFDDKAY
jgi:hypothetical protein